MPDDQHELGPQISPPPPYRVFVPFWEKAHLAQVFALYVERNGPLPLSVEEYVDDPVRSGYITPHASEARYYQAWLQRILHSQLPLPNAFLFEVIVPVEPEPPAVPKIEPLLPSAALPFPFDPETLDEILQAAGHQPSRLLPDGRWSTGYRLFENSGDRRFAALRHHLAIAGEDYLADRARLPELAGYHEALSRAGYAVLFCIEHTPFVREAEALLLVGDATNIDTAEHLRRYLATLRRYARRFGPEDVTYATARREVEKWQALQKPLEALRGELERHRRDALALADGHAGRAAEAFWRRGADTYERLLACLAYVREPAV